MTCSLALKDGTLHQEILAHRALEERGFELWAGYDIVGEPGDEAMYQELEIERER